MVVKILLLKKKLKSILEIEDKDNEKRILESGLGENEEANLRVHEESRL